MDTENQQPDPDRFTCANCGRTFTKARTDEEALEEYKRDWPETQGDDTSIVCEDCYKAILGWIRK